MPSKESSASGESAHRPGGRTTERADERAALVADLAQRLVEVQARGHVDRTSTTGDGPARAELADAAGPDKGSSARPPSRRSTSGRARSGGANGAVEDEPGDPQVLARQICLRQLALAPRSRAQLAQALQRRGIPTDAADVVLDRLTDVGLIDDVAYAQAFVRVKHRDRALGRSALRNELRRVGIAAPVAEIAVGQVDDESERARAEAFVARKIHSAAAAGPEAARRRLLGALTRRGYPTEVVLAVVDQAIDDLRAGRLDPSPLAP